MTEKDDVILLTLDSQVKTENDKKKVSMTIKSGVILVGKRCISTPVILDLIEDDRVLG